MYPQDDDPCTPDTKPDTPLERPEEQDEDTPKQPIM